MNKGVVLFVVFVSIQNLFCASPFHRAALAGAALAIHKEKEKELERYKESAFKVTNPESALRSMTLATIKDEQTRGSRLLNLNRCFIHSAAGILAMFNGPLAQTARRELEEWIKKEKKIKTVQAMRSVVAMIRKKVHLRQSSKTTGAIVSIAKDDRLILGRFSDDYVFALKRGHDITFLSSCESPREHEVVNPEYVEEFSPYLGGPSALVLATGDVVDLLKPISSEPHEVLGGIVDNYANHAQSAIEIMENTRRLAGRAGGVERMRERNVEYSPRATVMVAHLDIDE